MFIWLSFIWRSSADHECAAWDAPIRNWLGGSQIDTDQGAHYVIPCLRSTLNALQGQVGQSY
jgi:hypothetical protein